MEITFRTFSTSTMVIWQATHLNWISNSQLPNANSAFLVEKSLDSVKLLTNKERSLHEHSLLIFHLYWIDSHQIDGINYATSHMSLNNTYIQVICTFVLYIKILRLIALIYLKNLLSKIPTYLVISQYIINNKIVKLVNNSGIIWKNH